MRYCSEMAKFPAVFELKQVSEPTKAKVLTRRSDFVAANKGLRNARAGFVLLTRPNNGAGLRYGITVTKKIGNAVVRNRMKRRFRELLRSALLEGGLADHDHVLIGRAGGVERRFAELAQDLDKALTRAGMGKGDGPRRRRPHQGSHQQPKPKNAQPKSQHGRSR